MCVCTYVCMCVCMYVRKYRDCMEPVSLVHVLRIVCACVFVCSDTYIQTPSSESHLTERTYIGTYVREYQRTLLLSGSKIDLTYVRSYLPRYTKINSCYGFYTPFKNSTVAKKWPSL